jgi:mono/diheme cytochrome c family protein
VETTSDDRLELEEPEAAHGHEGEPGMPFFPDFALREALTALAFLCGLIIVASVTSPPLEEMADPNASGYVPRPEWYFLWMFEGLKYFKGESEVIGTFVIPTIAIGLLVGLPFLDRRTPRTHRLMPGTRPVRVWPRVAGAVVMGAILGLTMLALASEIPMTGEGQVLTQAQAAGKALYEKMGCNSCHVVGESGGDRGPVLTDFGSRPDAQERVLLHFTGVGQAEQSIMPGYQLSDEELRSLALYLMSLKEADEG